jgi:hypothetical protein
MVRKFLFKKIYYAQLLFELENLEIKAKITRH